ncbi:unnamed protein product [Symbiodinium sp. CCMP2456]|nr:unnamed protein product [Symbiodinium sp. CCMP2456]
MAQMLREFPDEAPAKAEAARARQELRKRQNLSQLELRVQRRLRTEEHILLRLVWQAWEDFDGNGIVRAMAADPKARLQLCAMGCGASTTVHPTSPCSRGPQSLRMSKKRVEAVLDLDAMTVLPNSPTQSPDERLDLEESSDEQMSVEGVEDEARLWSSMNIEDVEANRNQPFPTPPDRRMHDRHLRRIEHLGRQMAETPHAFALVVLNRRCRLIDQVKTA